MNHPEHRFWLLNTIKEPKLFEEMAVSKAGISCARK